MTPELKNIVSGVLTALAGAAASWGVSKGLVPAANQHLVENDLVTFAFGVGGALVLWWSKRQASQKAMIQAVNAADNGVKVVPATMATASIPTVNEPMKGPGT